MRYRKTFGVLLLFLGLVAVVLAGLNYWQGRRPIQLTVLNEMPITGINQRVEGAVGDAPRITVPETPPPGRTVHVNPKAADGGDGSWDHPWNDLQTSLCRLEPGDRLLVLAGTYWGPLSVGEDCKDGTPDKPIEVYFSDDALLTGHPNEEPIPAAVLRLGRSLWRIAGAEIRPLAFVAGVAIGPAVHGVIVDGAHISGGVGSGITVEPGSHEVTITRNHLHQLGSLESGGANEERDGAGIRIAPGTRAIAVTDTKIHNIYGIPVRVLTPEDYGDPTLAPAAEVTIDDELFQENQEKWW